jgi:protein gp37
MAKRLHAMGVKKYEHEFEVILHESALDIPLQWKKTQTIFVNSMSDLFHEEVPEPFIQRVFETMRRAYWHQFQILTKRSERLLELNANLNWPPNVWMGVSVENQRFTHRIDHLRQTQAHLKFLSLEPLLGPLTSLDLAQIDWVIVGGESGPGARPMRPEWVSSIKNQCLQAEVSFFFKQWGGVQKKRNGRELEGRTWNDMPLLQLAT